MQIRQKIVIAPVLEVRVINVPGIFVKWKALISEALHALSDRYTTAVFFFLSWDIIYVEHCVNLSCTCQFDIHRYYLLYIVIYSIHFCVTVWLPPELQPTPPAHHIIAISFFVVRTFKI